MLILVALASLGAQACVPIQSFSEQALGTAGTIATGAVSYPGQPEAPGCTVTVAGGPSLGESFVSIAAKLDHAISAAGWSRDLAADADGPDGTAAGYTLGAQRLAVSVNRTGRGPTYEIVLFKLPLSQAALSLILHACRSRPGRSIPPAPRSRWSDVGPWPRSRPLGPMGSSSMSGRRWTASMAVSPRSSRWPARRRGR